MSPDDDEQLMDLDELCGELAKWVDATHPKSNGSDEHQLHNLLDEAWTYLDKARDTAKAIQEQQL